MLGIGERGGRTFHITDEQRSRHMHVIGASGTGKSKFLEHLIRQDILAGRGLCLIDPHGTLADEIVRFCASRNIERYHKVHVIEPGNEIWSVGFNPLRADGTDPMLRVDTMVAACAEVWGGENVDEAPLLATCLQLVFYALAVQNLTLVEAIELTQAFDAEGIRAALTGKLPDYVFQSYWDDFRALPRREFEERFSSTRRRLLRFLGAPGIRRIVGQRERVLDAKRAMDESEILIINLAPRGNLSATSARLFGALVASEFFLTALSRTTENARRHPFYLYIDECYDFLTGDIEKMLDQTRKFGLHLVLCHHRLAQLRARSEAVYSGVMAGAQTKVVFGGLMDEDADIIAREIMRDSFNLERPKRSLDKPVVVGDELIWLEGHATAEGHSVGRSSAMMESWSEHSGASAAVGESYRVFEWDDPLQTGMQLASGTSSGAGRGGASSEGEFVSRTTSASRSSHQALRARYEVRPMQVHSLEEEVHLAILKLKEQKNRNAIVKLRGQKAKGVSVPEVNAALANPVRIEEFKRIARERSGYMSLASHADAEISARRTSLGMVSSDEEPQFWQEE